MAVGDNLSGLIFGKIVGSDATPLADVQVDISYMTCDVETNNGFLTIFPSGNNKLRGATTANGVFCVAFEFKATDTAKLMSRVYDARLVALKWAPNFQQERPALRFTAKVGLALDVKSWFISGIGAPTWNSPASDVGTTAAGLWGTYRAAMQGAKVSFPNVPTLSNEHFGLAGSAGVVVMPPV